MPRTRAVPDARTDNLRHVSGHDVCLFGSRSHARCLDLEVPHRVISRVFQGRCLRIASDELADLILGVVGRAKLLCTDILLSSHGFLSSQAHGVLRGSADDISAFTALL